MDIFKDKWDESYGRGENFIFYPKEEVVKFLNRFVRKRTGPASFRDILDFTKTVRGLDYGCGIGRQAVLMREFGLEAYGMDISSTAIAAAKDLSSFLGFPDMKDKFATGDGHGIPFPDGHFDVTICDSVLDSMRFELAKTNLREIARVTSRYAFITLISGNDSTHYREFDGEEIGRSQHEQGTCQTFYNWTKVKELARDSGFIVHWAHIVEDESLISRYKYGRYFIVLKKA